MQTEILLDGFHDGCTSAAAQHAWRRRADLYMVLADWLTGIIIIIIQFKKRNSHFIFKIVNHCAISARYHIRIIQILRRKNRPQPDAR